MININYFFGKRKQKKKKPVVKYRGADKSLARPGRKQATATEDFDFNNPIYNHNWRNINIYIYIYIYI